MKRAGKVFVVAGPSGAGKDTLIKKVLETTPDVRYSVSATTRRPGEGEVDGRDYYFLSDSEFTDLAGNGAFLEWEEVFGNRYGTLKSEVEKAAAAGKDLLLELDVKGALNVKSKIDKAVLIFIVPPSLEELKERLKDRNREAEEEMRLRAEIAPREIEAGRDRFDVLIVNVDVDRAAGELKKVLKGEKP